MIIWTIITGVLIIRVDRTKFDVITHQTVKVHRDRSFAGPRQGLAEGLGRGRTVCWGLVAVMGLPARFRKKHNTQKIKEKKKTMR